MNCLLPACPFLPEATQEMDASVLSAHGRNRGIQFYLSALTYAHYLWRKALPSRSILLLDRAFGADLNGREVELNLWPMPYQAMAWILRHSPPELLIGNVRVHFEHLASRMNEPRREQRSSRAWACWALARQILPDLSGDPRNLSCKEPAIEEIEKRLLIHGVPGEAVIWEKTLRNI
jgi:hypothetical protein